MTATRGQTTLDFAIGMSLFLAVVLFVFLFVPGMLQPFTLGTQEETVGANRIADQVSQDMLGSPREPYVLDRFCTVEFFAGNSPSQCRYGSGSLGEQLGLTDRQHVNITIRGNTTLANTHDERLCWDAGEAELQEDAGGTCADADDTKLSVGSVPPQDNDASVTASRVVWLAGDDVTVEVVMW